MRQIRQIRWTLRPILSVDPCKHWASGLNKTDKTDKVGSKAHMGGGSEMGRSVRLLRIRLPNP